MREREMPEGPEADSRVHGDARPGKGDGNSDISFRYIHNM